MSFFKEIVDEFKREIEKATAEIGIDIKSLDKSLPHSVGADIIEHHPKPNQQSRAHMSSGKKRKRAQKQQASGQIPAAQQHAHAPASGPPAAPAAAGAPGTAVARRGRHRVVAGLNARTARDSIVIAEVLGPPVSKRHNRRAFTK